MVKEEKIMNKKLSEEITSCLFYEQIEEILFNESIIIDKGYCLELYGNPDGKHDSESSNGTSTFIYIDEELTYEELLKMFEQLGSVKDDTLTIRIVDEGEIQERKMCKSNPVSKISR